MCYMLAKRRLCFNGTVRLTKIIDIAVRIVEAILCSAAYLTDNIC